LDDASLRTVAFYSNHWLHSVTVSGLGINRLMSPSDAFDLESPLS